MSALDTHPTVRALRSRTPLPMAEAARPLDAAWLVRLALDAGAELLWPEEESLYALMCMQVESGRSSFEREKQGSPVNPDQCEWPEDYFGDDLWFTVTTIVDDPKYLNEPFVTSSNFKREPNGSKWRPAPCKG